MENSGVELEKNYPKKMAICLVVVLAIAICLFAYFQEPKASNYDELLMELKNVQKGDLLVFKEGIIVSVCEYSPSGSVSFYFITSGKAYRKIDTLADEIKDFGVVNETKDPKLYLKLMKLFIRNEKYLE